ncbi:hypothetical protein ACYJ2U_001625 [Clostridium botulinum]
MRTGFRFEEIITREEKAAMYGVANGQKFNKEDVNKQLIKARLLK